jgi:hypothetical protein
MYTFSLEGGCDCGRRLNYPGSILVNGQGGFGVDRHGFIVGADGQQVVLGTPTPNVRCRSCGSSLAPDVYEKQLS